MDQPGKVANPACGQLIMSCSMGTRSTRYSNYLEDLLALCRRSERHRYVMKRPDKLGTDPMTVDGVD